MQPKPELFSSDYAQVFRDPEAIAAYPSRPPYARAAIEFVAELATDRPARVLDIGCGLGDIARRLASLDDQVMRWICLQAYHPGQEWCAKECLGHMLESERRGFNGRIRTILSQSEPMLQGWDQQAVARERRDANAPRRTS